ncbi:MAG TPA: permease [Caldilineaceae bacterium]|nr:permease [Caldilineaceae bacterium]
MAKDKFVGELTTHELTTPALSPIQPNRWLRPLLLFGLLILILAAIFGDIITTGGGRLYVAQRFQTFVTIFLGIFIEAVPFLLLGSIVSGLLAVFVDQSMLDRYLPRRAVPAAFSGAALGLLFPVCECGVVPVTRRLYEKGLPMSMGVAFLLAAPVINPIVMVSTYAAFGWSAVLWGRIGFSFAVAAIIGLIFHVAHPHKVLLPAVHQVHTDACNHHPPAPQQALWGRFQQALTTAGDDFLDMARYLIMGSLLAATMQTVIPQTVLLAIGQGAITSVLAMQALAFILSVCSTVDAFLALAFSGVFTTGSIITFLTFGPMVDIKSALMFLGVFQRRIVFYLIVLPLLLTLLIGVYWNLNIGV